MTLTVEGGEEVHSEAPSADAVGGQFDMGDEGRGGGAPEWGLRPSLTEERRGDPADGASRLRARWD